MRTLHTLLVISEATRDSFRALLARLPEIRVVAEVATVPDARAAVEILSVDLVLLETALQGEDGFDFLQSVPAEAQVVCLTRSLTDAMCALSCGVGFMPLPGAPGVLADVLARMTTSTPQWSDLRTA